MKATGASSLSWDVARSLLGVSADASETQIRAAYLEQVRQHPPDAEPERFEQIRDAYALLRDPAMRARLVLVGPDPSAPLAQLFHGMNAKRRFVGARPWLDVLKEKRP